MADNLIFKARDELVGTEGQFIAFRLAAFKCLAIYKAFKVNNGDVAVFRGSVFNGHKSCVLLEHTVEFRFHFVGRNFGGFFGHF